MSVQIQEARHPFFQYVLNAFGMAKAGKPKQAAVTLADLRAMPKQTQLLLAHYLEQDNSDVMLLDRDTDVCGLLSAGWLTSRASGTIGIVRFRIKNQIWRQLKSLSAKFIDDDLLLALESYRNRKSHAYPWVWW